MYMLEYRTEHCGKVEPWSIDLQTKVPTATIAHSREPELDILRGVAILLAMGWHLNHTESSGLLAALMWPGARLGWAGVDLFFVLSGFLVGGILLREFDRTGHIDYRRFFIRRIFRLWPVLYLFLFAMLASGAAPPQGFFWQIALHIQNYTGTQHATHLWSLAVEEHFYILLALLFSVIAGRAKQWGILIGVLYFVVFLSPIIRLLGLYFGERPEAIQVETHFRLDGLALGVLLAYQLNRRPESYRKMQRNRMALTFVVVAGLVFIALNDKYSALGLTLGYSAAALASAAALLLIHRSNVQCYMGAVGQLMIFLGLVSYPLYLWHVPAAHLTGRIAAAIGLPTDLSIVAQYFVSVIAAWTVSKVAERPMNNLRDILFPGVSAATARPLIVEETLPSASTSPSNGR